MAIEQEKFCASVVADLVRLFPKYPATWFTSNAPHARPGDVLKITLPSNVARELIDAFVQVNT